MNGICERHNEILKSSMDKVVKESSNVDIAAVLSYSTYSKNALIDNKGFSPFQRVYGASPNIPHLMVENPTTLNGNFRNDSVASHLMLLHKTREAYMSSESNERIKRALLGRIYQSEGPFYSGEDVYFWNTSKDKKLNGWRGPATVLGQEGQVVIVRQGEFYT